MKLSDFLVESGANKDQGTTDDGSTPLFIAAEKGHLEVVRFLVESGANKDQGTTNYGATAVFIAARNGHLEVVRFLVSTWWIVAYVCLLLTNLRSLVTPF